MTAIGSATGLNIDLATLLRGNQVTEEAAALAATSSSSQSSQSSESNPSGRGPATVVDLSDRAKAIVARANEAQKVADLLDRTIAKTDGGAISDASGASDSKPLSLSDIVGGTPDDSAKDPGSAAKKDDPGASILQKYGDLPSAQLWAARARADNMALMKEGTNNFDLQQMEGYARAMDGGGQVDLGQENMSDNQAYVQDIQLTLAQKVISLEKAGAGDKAQALRDAVNNGTVKVQKTADVPDLNMTSFVTHFADAGGGGTGAGMTLHPTGDAKAALDGGHAIVVSGVDRGTFFVSW